jgi:glycerate kinase
MQVLVCPDKFAGTLSGPEAAAAIAEGWLAVRPEDEVIARPVADGGPGFLDALGAALPSAVRLAVPVVGPLGDPVMGTVLIDGATAYVEAAHACGLALLPVARRDPALTSTFGVGGLVAAAVESGARTVVIGLGGSATNDGGAGLLAALGAAPVDAAGYVLPYGGAALLLCHGLSQAPRLRGTTLVGASDVDNPLTGLSGATAVYGPQKGATPEQVSLLDSALAVWAKVLSALPTCPPALASQPGAGAAGGLGAAILATGGRLVSGFAVVRSAIGLDAALAGADLVITGEGSFDGQSLRGKAVAGVASAARDQGLPCVVLAGRVAVDAQDAAQVGINRALSLVDHFGGDMDAALSRPAEGLRALAADLARAWPI